MSTYLDRLAVRCFGPRHDCSLPNSRTASGLCAGSHCGASPASQRSLLGFSIQVERNCASRLSLPLRIAYTLYTCFFLAAQMATHPAGAAATIVGRDPLPNREVRRSKGSWRWLEAADDDARCAPAIDVAWGLRARQAAHLHHRRVSCATIAAPGPAQCRQLCCIVRCLLCGSRRWASTGSWSWLSRGASGPRALRALLRPCASALPPLPAGKLHLSASCCWLCELRGPCVRETLPSPASPTHDSTPRCSVIMPR